MEPEAIKCPKCGEVSVYTKYVPATPSVVVGGVIKQYEQVERLKRECGGCGYYWHTPCDDAKREQGTTIGGTNV